MLNIIPAKSLAWVRWFAINVDRKCIFTNQATFLLARSAMTRTSIVRVLNNADHILYGTLPKSYQHYLPCT